MKSFSAFYPRILPLVPGCSQPLADQAVIDSSIEFCEKSLVLRQQLTQFSTVAPTSVYTLTPPSAQEDVARVLNVWVDGTLINPAAANQNFASSKNSGKPTVYFSSRANSVWQLEFNTAPDQTYTVNVEVALVPLRTATSVQDDLYNLWVEAITAGALGRLMTTPNQPFTDMNTGNGMLLKAGALTSKARIEGTKGKVQASARVTPRPLA